MGLYEIEFGMDSIFILKELFDRIYRILMIFFNMPLRVQLSVCGLTNFNDLLCIYSAKRIGFVRSLPESGQKKKILMIL